MTRASRRTSEGDVFAVSIDDDGAKFKACGFVCDGGAGEARKAVTARLELRSYNLGDVVGTQADTDAELVADLRGHLKLIGGPGA